MMSIQAGHERTYYNRDRDVIREYQWIEHRNKIGLSTSKIRIKKNNEQRQLDKTATDFIQKNIKRKESYEEGIKELETNAFGKVKFVNCPVDKPARYIRLADNTDMAHVKELVQDIWGMLKHKRKPNLVISVVGGTKHVSLDGKKRDALKKAILAAAKPTNAWFVTEGINMGCSKFIGEIVKEGQFYVKAKEDKSLTKMTRGLKAIGICSWRFIAKQKLLVNKENHRRTEEDYDDTKTYNPMPGKNDTKPSLDQNHTHFLLVDNGREQEQGFDREVTKLFYGKFLDELRKEKLEGGLEIPLITLLLEGGTTAIEKVHDSLDRGVPCVIVEGSGGSADILAYACKNESYLKKENNEKEEFQKNLEKLIEEKSETAKKNKNRKHDMLERIDKIINYPQKLITIINLDKEEEDRDKKILLTLLSANNFDFKKKMKFSLNCDRADIASELFANCLCCHQENTMDAAFKAELMQSILLKERTEMLELFLINDFSLHEFLEQKENGNGSRLKTLYNESAKNHPEMKHQFQKYTDLAEEKEEITLKHIDQFIKVFMRNHNSEENRDYYEHTESFEDPHFELFIWAVLSNKPTLVDFFLTKTRQPLLSLLFAAAYHKRRFSMSDRQTSYIMQEKANLIMEIAFENDGDIALALLDRPYPRFGGASLKTIALNANLKGFLANEACKESIRSQWKRGFIKINPFVSFFAVFFPVLVWIPWTRWTPFFKFLKIGDQLGGDLTLVQKVFVFYCSPIVKYVCSVISSLFLLYLYSFVALFYFGYDHNRYEIGLFSLLLVYLFYEIREVFNNPCSGFCAKIKNHLGIFWNQLDLAIYLFFIGSFVLKNFVLTFMVARVLFAINGFLLYVRLLRVYHTSFSLGPKLIVFQKMLPQLQTFIVLLVVFLLGYGMASQALLTPAAKFKSDYIRNPSFIEGMVFAPYWQMYGELNIDQIDEKINGTRVRSLLNSTLFCDEGEGLSENCEDFSNYKFVVKAMLGVYLLIGNVMLLNMLIAIFSHIYEKVDKNAKSVWWYELYHLVEDYDQLPGLGPLFWPFELIYTVIRALRKKSCCKNKKGVTSVDYFATQYFTGKFELFEKDSFNIFVKREADENQDHLDSRIKKIGEQISEIKTNIEELTQSH